MSATTSCRIVFAFRDATLDGAAISCGCATL
eukprot:CAMPEP_0119367612 /NCGR_PEP_ID=MMETSP1334-20130426/14386_1 /TAXON_ID=127549 /ORGANISM="Calcidiscus leptoporus, Strain RCC1130" /LENGTH=30 /DNA_ID= /DNA_START= /DNA_END= /DNA_ORIENTATION=